MVGSGRRLLVAALAGRGPGTTDSAGLAGGAAAGRRLRRWPAGAARTRVRARGCRPLGSRAGGGGRARRRTREGGRCGLPFEDASFDVVVAGEILEHVLDLDGTVAEALRVLRPGGTFVCDTINATRFARLALVTIGERVRGGPPPACHDPALFVDPARLQALCARGGVDLEVHGLRPAPLQFVGFLLRRRTRVEMVRTRSLAAVYQGSGIKRR